VVGFKILTFKWGFIIGAVVGFGAWAFVHGRAIFVPAPELAAGLIATWAAIFIVLAIVMVFISAFRRKYESET
jgi:Zn-dependent protease with chaperone function